MTAPDHIHGWTDQRIKRLAEKLRYHYRKSARELSTKAEAHLESYKRSLVKMRGLLEDGSIGADEFERWKRTQAAVMARDAKMVADLTETAQKATSEARKMISDELPTVYAESANYTGYLIDRAVRRDTSFSLLNRDAVLHLMQRNPKLLPISEESVLKGATERWHSQKLVSAITQGVIQGESVPDIAKRVRSVSSMDYRAATRAARTALTCAENAGRQSSYERAAANGIEGEKEWVATIDDRTRDSHVQLDGERVGVSERFSNGLMEPADPSGAPEEVWNCRCATRFVVSHVSDSQMERWDRLPAGTSYEDWKNRK